MKASSVWLFLLFLAATLGCRGKQENVIDSVGDGLCANLLSRESTQGAEERLLSRLSEIGDDGQRHAAIRELTRRLLTIPLADKTYSHQRQLMRRISDLVEEMVSSRFVRQNEAELRCEVRLVLADWWRGQLVRLKPTRRNSSAVLDWKNVEEARRVGDWRACYMASFLSYRSLVNRIEFWWYPEDEKQFGEEVAKRLKNQIEKSLGRPLRKERHWPEDWKWETEEFAGVRERRLSRTE